MCAHTLIYACTYGGLRLMVVFLYYCLSYLLRQGRTLNFGLMDSTSLSEKEKEYKGFTMCEANSCYKVALIQTVFMKVQNQISMDMLVKN